MESNTGLVIYYKAARHLDPRFQYLDWARQFINAIHMAESDLKELSAKRQVRTAKEWVDAFDGERRELGDERSANRQAIGSFIFNVILSSALGVMFTGFGNYVWSHIAQLLPK
jgi:hypothetical protein